MSAATPLYLFDSKSKQYYELSESKAITIGRTPDNTIVLPDMHVSSRHCVVAGGKIRDVGSTNGTTLNGEALMPEVERVLKENDELNCGGNMKLSVVSKPNGGEVVEDSSSESSDQEGSTARQSLPSSGSSHPFGAPMGGASRGRIGGRRPVMRQRGQMRGQPQAAQHERKVKQKMEQMSARLMDLEYRLEYESTTLDRTLFVEERKFRRRVEAAQREVEEAQRKVAEAERVAEEERAKAAEAIRERDTIRETLEAARNVDTLLGEFTVEPGTIKRARGLLDMLRAKAVEVKLTRQRSLDQMEAELKEILSQQELEEEEMASRMESVNGEVSRRRQSSSKRRKKLTIHKLSSEQTQQTVEVVQRQVQRVVPMLVVLIMLIFLLAVFMVLGSSPLQRRDVAMYDVLY